MESLRRVADCSTMIRYSSADPEDVLRFDEVVLKFQTGPDDGAMAGKAG